MGSMAFTNLLTSTKDRIETMVKAVDALGKRVERLSLLAVGGGTNAEESPLDLEDTVLQFNLAQIAVTELKEFMVKIRKEWTKPKDRIIGYVAWAPAIAWQTPPYGYTKDLCVIKLDKKRFSQNFRGNVLDLGVC